MQVEAPPPGNIMANETQVRVITINTWKGEGFYQARLRLMVEQLGLLSPDVLLLQECVHAPDLGHDTAGTIARELGLHVARWSGRFKRRLCEGEEAFSTSGVAVLSRAPIRDWRTVLLPDDPRDGERAMLFAKIDHPAGPIVAAALHLTHLHDARPLRGRQFASALAAMPPSSAKAMVVLGGDFNAPADAPEFRDARLSGDDDLVDCRLLAGVPARPTLVGGGKGACLDHILVLIRQDVTNHRVLTVSNVLDQPDPQLGLLASDHLGVMATFMYAP
jgi:endonuclease/exonuclease/phosphatase family metal-dependent hydrolase